MELADRNLQSVLFDYQNQGQPGIPRKQLLGFLPEAAEALDVINFQYGLQHLDVKPHNLFVVSNHVKVADFGLVNRLPGRRRRPVGPARGGATPLYASPETLQGSLSRHSDQYSLAIVYQQLLTGTVPFWSANPYQLLLKHLSGQPDLSALPRDRPAAGGAGPGQGARSSASPPAWISCMRWSRRPAPVPASGRACDAFLAGSAPPAGAEDAAVTAAKQRRGRGGNDRRRSSPRLPRVTLADLPPAAVARCRPPGLRRRREPPEGRRGCRSPPACRCPATAS